MNNLLTYQYWGLGYIEEVLHGEIYKPAGVCRHQCWSETMVLQPAIEGMLGFELDAVNHSFTLSPKFPADWDSIFVKNIKVGEHSINFSMERKNNLILFSFQHTGPSSIHLYFDPILPHGTKIQEIKVKGNFETKKLNKNVNPDIYIDDSVTLEYKIKGGIKILPAIPYPMPGDTSTGIRILSDWLEKDIYNISVEARKNSKHTFEVFINDWQLNKVINGKLLSKEGNIHKIEANFMESNNEYDKLLIQIEFEGETED